MPTRPAARGSAGAAVAKRRASGCRSSRVRAGDVAVPQHLLCARRGLHGVGSSLVPALALLSLSRAACATAGRHARALGPPLLDRLLAAEPAAEDLVVGSTSAGVRGQRRPAGPVDVATLAEADLRDGDEEGPLTVGGDARPRRHAGRERSRAAARRPPAPSGAGRSVRRAGRHAGAHAVSSLSSDGADPLGVLAVLHGGAEGGRGDLGSRRRRRRTERTRPVERLGDTRRLDEAARRSAAAGRASTTCSARAGGTSGSRVRTISSSRARPGWSIQW